MSVISNAAEHKFVLKILVVLITLFLQFIFPEFYKLVLLCFILYLAFGSIRLFRDHLF